MKNLKTKLSLLLALVFVFALTFGFQSMAAGGSVEEAKASVLTYEGMLARTRDYSGIRSLFRIDKAALDILEQDGYTVEIGAMMAAHKANGQTYFNVDDLEIEFNAEKGWVATENNVSSVVVYSSANAAYATSKYISQNDEEYQFAFTTAFKDEYENATYYTAEFCYRGFVALTKEGAEPEILYIDANGQLLGNSISLYEIVAYFVSDDCTHENAEQYAKLPMFQEIVETVRTEYPELDPEAPETPDEPEEWDGVLFEATIKEMVERKISNVSFYNNDPDYFLKDSDEDGYYSFGQSTASAATNARNYITITFTVSKAGQYNINYDYKTGTSAQAPQINHYLDNGAPVQANYSIKAEGGYSKGATVYLTEGEHTIILHSRRRGFEAKSIQIKLADEQA